MSNVSAVVLGGTGGIGEAVVRALSESATVLFTYLNRRDRAEELALSTGGYCTAMCADITSEDDLRSVATKAEQLGGGVDVVVNAAGAGRSLPLEQLDAPASLATMSVHLLAPILVAKVFGPVLAADRGGALVFVSSVAAISPEPRGHDYVAAKGGLVAVTRSLARDLAPAVAVNSVAPGWINTSRRPRLDEEIVGRIPLHRFGSPIDVAAAVGLLASTGGHITGQTIVVDGGYSL